MTQHQYQSMMISQLVRHWQQGEFDEYEHKIDTLALEFEHSDEPGDLVIGDRDYIERLVQQELEAQP